MGPLKLGVEILAKSRAELSLGTFFETWISLEEGTLKRSVGRDEYHLALTVEAGHRLAATGRTHICQLDAAAAGLGCNQAAPANPVPGQPGPGRPVFLGLRTNAFLDLSALTAGISLRLIALPGEGTEIPLTDQRVTAEQIGPGRFLIELGQAL